MPQVSSSKQKEFSYLSAAIAGDAIYLAASRDVLLCFLKIIGNAVYISRIIGLRVDFEDCKDYYGFKEYLLLPDVTRTAVRMLDQMITTSDPAVTYKVLGTLIFFFLSLCPA